MKRFIIIIVLIISLSTSCKKDDITPLKPHSKKIIIDCRGCSGGWDLTDTIPE